MNMDSRTRTIDSFFAASQGVKKPRVDDLNGGALTRVGGGSLTTLTGVESALTRVGGDGVVQKADQVVQKKVEDVVEVDGIEKEDHLIDEDGVVLVLLRGL